jgi:membrane-associated phospholipid phosphatase
VTRNKGLIITARVVSIIFTPFYLPLVGIALLLTFTFLSGLPTKYKLLLAATVYLLTVFIPTVLIFLYRLVRGWSLQELGRKRNRIVPYAISITSYLLCIWLLDRVYVNHEIISIIIAALIIQAVSIIVNFFWKISTHTAAIGGVTGALVAYGFLFEFNPVGWLCLAILVSGIVGSARIILRQHSLAQVVGGYFIGVVCAFVSITYL